MYIQTLQVFALFIVLPQITFETLNVTLVITPVYETYENTKYFTEAFFNCSFSNLNEFLIEESKVFVYTYRYYSNQMLCRVGWERLDIPGSVIYIDECPYRNRIMADSIIIDRRDQKLSYIKVNGINRTDRDSYYCLGVLEFQGKKIETKSLLVNLESSDPPQIPPKCVCKMIECLKQFLGWIIGIILGLIGTGITSTIVYLFKDVILIWIKTKCNQFKGWVTLHTSGTA